jgi:ribose/xylose/arabinose/galactoside ABC-type transport system permease subunit
MVGLQHMVRAGEKSKYVHAKIREIAKRILGNENTVLISILMVISIVVAVLSRGVSISPTNIKNIVLFSATVGIAAIGQFFVILTAGIDLSLGGVAVMCVLFGARLMTLMVAKQLFAGPLPIYQAIPIMLLAGLAVGALNGTLVSRVGVPALIVTLGMWIMAKGAGLLISMGSIYRLPRALAFIGQGEIAGIPVSIIILIVVAAIAYFFLYHTPFGKSVYAVGGNPVAAHLSGIRTQNILLVVYMISGTLAALAGLILLSRTLVATNVMAKGLELDSIAACVLGGVSLAGGRGTLIGVIIGVLIIGTINNGMIVLALHPSLQDLVRGAVIFAAVAVDSWRRR